MSKVLFIGDPHLKITRFDLAKNFLSWINHVIKTEKPDLVVNLGDTFDTHAVVRSEVLSEFLNHVDFVRDICPYIYLLGNHDMFKPNDNKYHALKHLKGKIDRFTIVDETINLHDMTFVPYVHNPENFPKQSLPICVAHQTFKGADFGDITTKDGVDASSVVGAEIIISGHIHKRQRMVAGEHGGPEVLYIGSPFSQSSSDINQIKGVSIIDTSSYKEEFISCPLPTWRGLKYEISPTFSIEKMHDDMSVQLNDTDHWVVEISGPKSEILGYLGSKKGKGITVGRDIKIKTVFTDREKRQVQIEALSLDHIISQYIDKVYSGSLDKELLKSKSIEIINELKNNNGLRLV
jgi:DNA repair exonuclease SbcCD nuclease subunit